MKIINIVEVVKGSVCSVTTFPVHSDLQLKTVTDQVQEQFEFIVRHRGFGGRLYSELEPNEQLMLSISVSAGYYSNGEFVVQILSPSPVAKDPDENLLVDALNSIRNLIDKIITVGQDHAHMELYHAEQVYKQAQKRKIIE